MRTKEAGLDKNNNKNKFKKNQRMEKQGGPSNISVLKLSERKGCEEIQDV